MIRRILAALILFATSLICSTAHAGVAIYFQLDPKTNSEVALKHVPVKGLVTEFLDPDRTGIGKSVAYLAWREVLFAIQDQSGAGVILARTPDEAPIIDLLEQDYHKAAIDIARSQQVRMALWGVVERSEEDLYLTTYLSLLPEVSGILRLRLTGEPALPPGLEAQIVRTNFNLPIVRTTRAELFNRFVVARKDTLIREEAAISSRVVQSVSKGTALKAEDMEKSWFKLKLNDGKNGYIDIDDLDIPPSRVEASTGSGKIFSHPGKRRQGKNVRLGGTYPVFNMRYIPKSGLWYEIETGDARGWIEAFRVRPRLSLPALHFVAGLYRYQLKRFKEAEQEFSQYVSAPSSMDENTSLATAYQLLGASSLLGHSDIFEAKESTLQYFRKAAEQTPYDPTAYAFIALASLAVRKELGASLRELEHALSLDPQDAGATTLLAALHSQLYGSNRSFLRMIIEDYGDPRLSERLQELIERYPIREGNRARLQ